MGAGHAEGPPQSGQVGIGPDRLEAKAGNRSWARANQGTRNDLLVNSPKGYAPMDTRKEMAQAVGIGEQTMGRITQLAKSAPQSLKEALESKKVSVNRGWKILKAVSATAAGGSGIRRCRDTVGCAGNRPDGCGIGAQT